ncbi:VOC family protein [Ferrovibrio sp.]|uniref:VOC family protein n=1 Tax=Ferrovibrio sp. TaxID=1917215 RepID=UPI003D2D5CE8
MQTNPYLSFNGDCREAMTLYAEVLGGEVQAMIAIGDTPMAADTPKERHHRIVHASVSVGGSILMAGDVPGEMYQPPVGITINIGLQTVAEAERVFKALSAGGSVQMELTETFWADRFGMFTDRFGTPWMINCGSKEVKPA